MERNKIPSPRSFAPDLKIDPSASSEKRKKKTSIQKNIYVRHTFKKQTRLCVLGSREKKFLDYMQTGQHSKKKKIGKYILVHQHL